MSSILSNFKSIFPSWENLKSPEICNVGINGAFIVTYGVVAMGSAQKIASLEVKLLLTALSATLQLTRSMMKEIKPKWVEQSYIDKVYIALPFIIIGIGGILSGAMPLFGVNAAGITSSLLVTVGFGFQQTFTTLLYELESEARNSEKRLFDVIID